MKTINHFLQIMILAIFMASFIPMNAQEIMINGSSSSDTTFNPFNGEHDVYSFKMNGYIELLSDSSLIRVVLIDHAGNHWLIYEAYPLIDTLNSFSVQDACDETCFLNKITPDSIRVDIINAIVSIEKFSYDLNEIQNVHDLQVQQKWVNDSVKIGTINDRIQEEHMYWRAGRSYLSNLSFSEKEDFFHGKYNAEGYEYYKGGIFKLLSSNGVCEQTAASNLPKQFDWRGKHEANLSSSYYYNYNGFTPGSNLNWGWITKQSLPSQGSNLTCWAFSGIALEEAYANLYYNNNLNTGFNVPKHQLNLERSVMELVSCYSQGFITCSTVGPNFTSVSNFLQSDYRHEKSCLTYSCPTTSPCPNWSSLSCYPGDPLKMTASTNVTALDAETFKQSLIKYGPISCGVWNYPSSSTYYHQMLLVGYKVIQQNDILYQGSGENDPPIIADENCPYIGTTKWNFKDSNWPNDYFNSIYLSFGNNPDYFYIDNLSNCGFFYDAIDKPYNTPSIKCSDEDGDGYYWWGIHWEQDPNNPSQLIQVSPDKCGCTPGVKVEEEDCDDNNIHAGPYITATTINPPTDSAYYCCLPLDCLTATVPVSINSTYNPYDWSKDLHINNSLIIEPDYTLTITNQVFLTPGVKIYIAPRARLLLLGTPDNYAKLSASCNEFWGGIEIGGNPFESQNPSALNTSLAQYQGKVEIQYGIIEKAECGIKTLNPEIIPGEWPTGGEPMCCSSSGGIIQATNAIFRNNKIGVEFYPYRWFNGDKPVANKSSFSACTFETTSLLLKDADPECFLKLDGINKLFITGCTFQNNYYENKNPLNLTPTYDHRGIGICTYNSELQIELPTSPNSTTFYRLKRGIYGMCSGMGLSDISIFNSKFYSNESGTYLSGYSEINHVDIENDEFYFTENFGASSLYGLYLNECSGYTVTLNKFKESGFSGSGSEQLIGVIVNNSGPKTNYIYNNKEIQGLTTGLQSQNINRGTYTFPDYIFPVPWNTETGLRFVCNDFENCDNDMAVWENMTPSEGTGITHYQRNAENSVGTQEPAGNTFSPDHSSQNPNDPGSWTKYDINMNPYVRDILYKFHYFPQNIRLKPVYVLNQDLVNYDPYYYSDYDKSTSCPDVIYSNTNSKEEIESIISQANFKIDSLITLLHYLTDDGSTDTLKSTVDNSTPNQSYDVYQELLSASPFLSDTVLKASIIKENVLQNPMIRDILVANPHSAKSENLLNTLDNRYIPMPDSMWAEIMNGQDTVGEMERLESELSGWVQLRDFYFNALVQYFLNDTINEGSSDSLVNLLQNDYNLISRFNLITYYLEKHSFTLAASVLQDIPNEFTLTGQDQKICQDFSDLISLLQQIVNDSSGYLIPDSIQTLVLQGLISEDYNLPAAFARNILIASGLLNYQEPILTESAQKSSRDHPHYGKNRRITSVFKVYPNPCKDFVILEYDKGNSSDVASCTIINTSANKLATYYLQRTSSQIVIPLNNIPPGTYLLQFKINGINKGTRQVVKVN